MADYVCIYMPESWGSDRNARVALVYLRDFRRTHLNSFYRWVCVHIPVYSTNSAAQCKGFFILQDCYLFLIDSIYDRLYSMERKLRRLYCTQVEKKLNSRDTTH